MNVSKSTINMTGVPVLTDDPPGTGALMMEDWKSKLFTACDAAGAIIKSVLQGDDKLMNMVRPEGAIPPEYKLELLKLHEDGIHFYEKPKDDDDKKVYNQWVAYGKLVAKMDKANSKIHTAIWSKLAVDLKLHVESKKTLAKSDGCAVFFYLEQRFTKGGAAPMRIKI